MMYGYSIEQWITFFAVYCFVGWGFESIYVSIEHRKWVNRGFLNGPFLPIYGFGAIIMLFAALPVRDNIALTFLFGMAGATALEYFTGYVMEKMFHVKYWDYTYEPLNVDGYICLGCSLMWGALSVLLVRVVHRPTERQMKAAERHREAERIKAELEAMCRAYAEKTKRYRARAMHIWKRNPGAVSKRHRLNREELAALLREHFQR